MPVTYSWKANPSERKKGLEAQLGVAAQIRCFLWASGWVISLPGFDSRWFLM